MSSDRPQAQPALQARRAPRRLGAEEHHEDPALVYRHRHRPRPALGGSRGVPQGHGGADREDMEGLGEGRDAPFIGPGGGWGAMLSDVDIDRIAEAVVAKLAPSAPLLSKTELAIPLGVQTAQIDRFVRKGMPRTTVGARPRFEFAACRTWLDARTTAQAASPPPDANPGDHATLVQRRGR
jgi:hypothetical protein